MGVYLYPNNTETELKDAYIGIPNPTSIVLDKSSISLTTVGQTEQLTATIEPTISDHSVTWSSDDTTVATVSTTGLVTCVTPGECTITATTVNGLTATCSVGQGWTPGANTVGYRPFKEDIKDYSGNGNDWTVYSGSVSFSDNMVNISNRLSRADLIYANRNSLTLSVYTSATQGEQYLYMSSENRYTSFSFGTFGDGTFVNQFWNNNIWYGANATIGDNNIHLLTSTRDGTTLKSYIDGVLVGSNTISVSIVSRPYLTLGNVSSYSYTSKRGDLILESKVRTAQEILDYFNQTKSLYGIS